MKSTTTIEEAWVEYQKQLLSFIHPKVDTIQDAEDILSHVFTKLIQQSNHSDIPDNIAAWLYQVTKNGIVDYYRTRKSVEGLPEGLITEEKEANALSQLSHCLLPMIQALPEHYQQVLILSEIEDKKYKELANELNISLPAVKSRVLRGREKLYKSITACCTLERDRAGNIIDYLPNNPHSCHHCDQ